VCTDGHNTDRIGVPGISVCARDGDGRPVRAIRLCVPVCAVVCVHAHNGKHSFVALALPVNVRTWKPLKRIAPGRLYIVYTNTGPETGNPSETNPAPDELHDGVPKTERSHGGTFREMPSHIWAVNGA
jgi:hypothetical protein